MKRGLLLGVLGSATGTISGAFEPMRWEFNDAEAHSLRHAAVAKRSAAWTHSAEGFAVSGVGTLRISGQGATRLAYAPLRLLDVSAPQWLSFEIAGWHMRDAATRVIYIGLAHSAAEVDRHRPLVQVRFRVNEKSADVSVQSGGSVKDGATPLRGMRIGLGSQFIPQRFALAYFPGDHVYRLYKYTTTGHWAEIGSGGTSSLLRARYVFVGADGDFNSAENERWEFGYIRLDKEAR